MPSPRYVQILADVSLFRLLDDLERARQAAATGSGLWGAGNTSYYNRYHRHSRPLNTNAGPTAEAAAAICIRHTPLPLASCIDISLSRVRLGDEAVLLDCVNDGQGLTSLQKAIFEGSPYPAVKDYAIRPATLVQRFLVLPASLVLEAIGKDATPGDKTEEALDDLLWSNEGKGDVAQASEPINGTPLAHYLSDALRRCYHDKCKQIEVIILDDKGYRKQNKADTGNDGGNDGLSLAGEAISLLLLQFRARVKLGLCPFCIYSRFNCEEDNSNTHRDQYCPHYYIDSPHPSPKPYLPALSLLLLPTDRAVADRIVYTSLYYSTEKHHKNHRAGKGYYRRGDPSAIADCDSSDSEEAADSIAITGGQRVNNSSKSDNNASLSLLYRSLLTVIPTISQRRALFIASAYPTMGALLAGVSSGRLASKLGSNDSAYRRCTATAPGGQHALAGLLLAALTAPYVPDSRDKALAAMRQQVLASIGVDGVLEGPTPSTAAKDSNDFDKPSRAPVDPFGDLLHYDSDLDQFGLDASGYIPSQQAKSCGLNPNQPEGNGKENVAMVPHLPTKTTGKHVPEVLATRNGTQPAEAISIDIDDMQFGLDVIKF